MANRQPKKKPTWTDVKVHLSAFDRKGFLGLIQELYAAHPDNQLFLHTRLGLGPDALKPYKETIQRWIAPDVFRRGPVQISVLKAKQAISSYKKAEGDPAGLAELMVFFCEEATGFCADVGNDDAAYYDAIVNMFGSAARAADELPPELRSPLFDRLNEVCTTAGKFGYGVPDAMSEVLIQFVDVDGLRS